MKKIYFASLALFIFTGCSKDFLKKYDDRIEGNWYISDVNKVGIGGDFDDILFREGSFTFNGDGTLTYTDDFGNVSSGTWDIQKRNVNDEVIRTFQVTTVDFNTQLVRSEFYDDMNFRGTDHFVATINNSFRSFVTHFRR
jgi:hypothetical protein